MGKNDDIEHFEAFLVDVEPQLRKALAGHLPESAVADAQARPTAVVGRDFDARHRAGLPAN